MLKPTAAVWVSVMARKSQLVLTFKPSSLCSSIGNLETKYQSCRAIDTIPRLIASVSCEFYLCHKHLYSNMNCPYQIVPLLCSVHVLNLLKHEEKLSLPFFLCFLKNQYHYVNLVLLCCFFFFSPHR